MTLITDFFSLLDSLLGSAAYFPIALLGVGLLFTIYLGFPQIRFFGHAWSVLTGKHSKADDPGDTSHFQALSTALSGTVGTGTLVVWLLRFFWVVLRRCSGCGQPLFWA